MGRKVIVGVAGGGKTSYAMSILERELRNGLRFDQIGFSSFSRAACREAAERAGRLLHEDPDRLQKTGWMKTIHAASLRALGVDPKSLIDHDTVEGKKFLKEACGSDRCGEPGTQAGKLDEALSAWDEARARLTLLKPDDDDLMDQLSGQDTISDPRTHGTHSDTLRTHKIASVSAPQVDVNSRFTHARTDKNPLCSIGKDFSSSHTRFHLKNSETDFVCPSVFSEYNPIEHRELRRGHNPQVMCPSVSNLSVQWAIRSLLDKIGKGKTLIQKYERHKRLYGRIDYTDILMMYAGIQIQDDLTFVQGYPMGSVPEEVQVWMFDEYQDCSPLLAKAAQRISEFAADVYLLGDGYQAIYGFSGASTAVFRDEEMKAKESGNRIVLNRTWRNTDSVIEWGESVLQEDSQYESRNPFGEAGDGSAGLMDRQEFDLLLPSLAGTDSLIISRAWFSLDSVKKLLDDLAIPWRSCQEDKSSRWQCPAKIAFTLVMRELSNGVKISEQDWRRVTVELPAKWNNQEMFVRGTKSKWKKMECGSSPNRSLMELADWGATDLFVEFVRQGKWRKDMPLLLDRAIDLYGVAEVRNPSIRLGSVHSVKGLEARNVFCLADSTLRVATEGDESEERCLKYVAITRSSMHYRLVVNRLDISRGKPLFWAAPAGESKYVAFDDPGIARAKESDSMVQGEGDQSQEIPSGSLQFDRDCGSDTLRSGKVCRDRDEGRREGANADATSESEGYQEEWWDL